MVSMLLIKLRNLNGSPWTRIIPGLLSLLLFVPFQLEAGEYVGMAERVTETSILMQEDDWNALRHTARSTEVLIPICGAGPSESPYEYLPATVTVDGVTLENVGIRAKGFCGSINPVRPSLKIKFDEFVEGQTLGDITQMALNDNNQDYTCMRTCLAMRTFQKAGLPASDCAFVHLRVNGEDLGVYSSVEPIKKPFLRKHFADDEGNLYEA